MKDLTIYSQAVISLLSCVEEHYPSVNVRPTYSFNLTGVAAGKCTTQFSLFGQLTHCHLEFNAKAIAADKAFFENETLPHEVAHFVIASLYGRSKAIRPHGPEWKRICIELGGSGARTHNLALKRSKQYRQWLYIDSNGHRHMLSTIRHRRVQSGTVYKARSSKATIEAKGFVEEVIQDAE
ncbi:hypothetical protein DU002_01800 [Corallincola holothuriorum]|uniref:SprT-like domain-containing protein n=1 Tax=Corallincola holothuriorum TaxID=2282215 RepID=A0A368NS05_9GAMM|nr:hypothetical protein DU002_01800 [Corallincola holothuriorum]